MDKHHLAMLVPDDFTRCGIEGLIRLHRHEIDITPLETLDSVFDQAERFDSLLMDTSAMKVEAVEVALHRLAACCPALRVVIISNQLKVLYIRHVMRLGAKGFLYVGDLSESLMGSLVLVANNAVTLSPQVLDLLTHDEMLYVSNDLTPLDLQVLRLMAADWTVKDMMEKMGISDRSIYRTRSKLRDMLGVKTNEKILDAAREQGLLD